MRTIIFTSILILGAALQSNLTVWPGLTDWTLGPWMFTLSGLVWQNWPTQPGVQTQTTFLV